MLAACYRTLALGFLLLASGCAMCGNCDDYSYSAHGGRWERLDPCHGRVGSAFTPEAGHRVETDRFVSPETSVEKPAKKNAESTPSESAPAGSTPGESAPTTPMPGETNPIDPTPGLESPGLESPAGRIPADDSAPKPPSTMTNQGKSGDTSVLRQRPRPVR